MYYVRKRKLNQQLQMKVKKYFKYLYEEKFEEDEEAEKLMQ